MKILRNKILSAIALILILTMTAPLVTLPTANAHPGGWNIPTFAYVAPVPNPIGLKQTTLIYMFLGNLPYPDAALTNDYRYRNYVLSITGPDGNVVQKKTWDYISDPTANQGFLFTPTQVGTYTLNFTYAGQKVNDYSHSPTSAYINDTFLPSSYVATLTVQNEPVPTVADPLPPQFPTEYWTRPIYGENTAWWNVSSNWLGTGVVGYGSMPGPNEQMFPGDAVGPLTGHVMWTKPLQSGGIVGGNNFVIQGNQYFEGSAYNQRFTNPIILNGRLYYTEPVSMTGVPGALGGSAYGPTDCVDLRTGQLIWSRADIPALSFGYIYDHEDPNQHGVYPALLFTSNFGRAFDADTGNPLFNVTGVPSGSSVRGPQGEILKYVMANAGNATKPDWRLGEWNSSKLWDYTGLSPVISGTVDASISNPNSANVRYDWNVTIPWRNTLTANPSILSVFPGNLLLLRNGSYPALGAYNPYTYFAVNLNNKTRPGYNIGDVLWWSTVNPPAGKNITQMSYAGADPTVGVFVESYRETSQFVGYSLTDGKYLWGPTTPQDPFDYFGSQGPGTLANQIANGKIYSSAYAGILYTYDLKNGEILWTYGNGGEGNSTNGALIVPGPYPMFVQAIGNGVVYLATSEHTVETPIYPGALARAVDATTGKEIWTLSNDNNEFATSSYAIADGYATFFNAYDNQIYSVGRGPTATTVDAPMTAITLGSSVVIRGTVTDISPGTKQNEQAARFPNGVPAVSDTSMSDWMAYVYQQKSRPKDAVGVEVILSERDSNGNTYYIGNVTTDAGGAYSFMWQPPIPGTYTIYATFAGTNGYWPSYAETAIGVVEAPQAIPAATAPATPTPTSAPSATPTFTAMPTTTTSPSPAPNPTSDLAMATYVAAAAAVIIVIIAATAIALKRRK